MVAGPYGHPFHPILVTIPIGTWIASLIFDLIGLGVADPSPFALGAQVLIAIGVIGALLAAIFGFIDVPAIASGTPARRTALIHLSLNLAAVALFAVNYFVRAASDHSAVNVAGLMLSIIGLAAIAVSGWTPAWPRRRRERRRRGLHAWRYRWDLHPRHRPREHRPLPTYPHHRERRTIRPG